MASLGDILRSNFNNSSADDIRREQARRFGSQHYANIAGTEMPLDRPAPPSDGYGRLTGDFSGTDIADPTMATPTIQWGANADPDMLAGGEGVDAVAAPSDEAEWQKAMDKFQIPGRPRYVPERVAGGPSPVVPPRFPPSTLPDVTAAATGAAAGVAGVPSRQPKRMQPLETPTTPAENEALIRGYTYQDDPSSGSKGQTLPDTGSGPRRMRLLSEDKAAQAENERLINEYNGNSADPGPGPAESPENYYKRKQNALQNAQIASHRSYEGNTPDADRIADRVTNDATAQRMKSQALTDRDNGKLLKGVDPVTGKMIYGKGQSAFDRSGGTPFLDRREAEGPMDLETRAMLLKSIAKDRAMTDVARPTAPDADLVADSDRARFYAGRNSQGPLSSSLEGLKEGEKTVETMPIDPVTGARRISGGGYNPNMTREGQMAARTRIMRKDPAYQQYIQAAKSANSSGSWANAEGGAPALGMDQVTVDGQRVSPLQISPARQAQIDRDREVRKQGEQGRLEQFQNNRADRSGVSRPNLTIREQAGIALGNRDYAQRDRMIDGQLQLSRDQGAREDKRFMQQQQMAARADMLAARDAVAQAEMEHATTPSPLTKQKLALAQRQAMNKEASYLAITQQGQAGGMPVPPSASGAGAGAESVDGATNTALDIGVQTKETSGPAAGARAYIRALGIHPNDMTPEQRAYGDRAFSAQHMNGAMAAEASVSDAYHGDKGFSAAAGGLGALLVPIAGAMAAAGSPELRARFSAWSQGYGW